MGDVDLEHRLVSLGRAVPLSGCAKVGMLRDQRSLMAYYRDGAADIALKLD